MGEGGICEVIIEVRSEGEITQSLSLVLTLRPREVIVDFKIAEIISHEPKVSTDSTRISIN